MKKITMRFAAIAMALAITLGATAQVNNFKSQSPLHEVNAQKTLKLAPAAKSGAVSVKDLGVTVTVDNITTSSAAITATMSDDCYGYYLMINTAGLFENYAAQNDVTITELMAANMPVFAQAGYASFLQQNLSSQTINALAPGTEYEVYVWAVASADDTVGAGAGYPFSTLMGGTTDAATCSISGQAVDNWSVDITMTANEAAGAYRMVYMESESWDYYQTEDGWTLDSIALYLSQSSNQIIPDNGIITVEDLAPGTTFTFFAVTVNQNLEMSTVSTCEVTTPGVCPDVTVSNNGEDLNFTLTPNSSTTAYTVYFADYMYCYIYYAYGTVDSYYEAAVMVAGEDGAFSGTTTATTITLDTTVVTNNGSGYLIAIHATDGTYNNNYAYNVWEFGTPLNDDPTQGIQTVSSMDMTVYPNPAFNTITINAQNLNTVELYNTLGQMVLSQRVSGSKASIDVNELNGVYILKAYSNDGNVATTKVVVK